VPRFLIQRNFGQRDEAEMGAIGQDTKRIISERCPDIVWEVSNIVVNEEGDITTFCIYEAPSEDRVREHASILGRHVIREIWEIGAQVSPADFPG
jgi:hypothetical protein